MGIVAIWKQQGTGDRPIIVCEACGKPIVSANECSLIWPDGEGQRAMSFIHSTQHCEAIIERREGKDYGNSLSLAAVLADLGSAMRIDWEAVKADTAAIQRTWDVPTEEEDR